MTQFNPLPPPPPPATFGTAGYALPPAVPTTSKLAVASLVFALFVCLLFVGPLLAIGLGIAALVVISRSNGKTKGSGLAAAGIAIGSLLLLVESGFAVFLLAVVAPNVNVPADRLAEFLQRVEKQEYVAARKMLSSAAYSAGTPEDLAALRRVLQSNYGPVTKVKVDWWARVYQSGVSPPASGTFSMFATGQSRSGKASGTVRGTVPVTVLHGQGGEAYGALHFSIGAYAQSSQRTGVEVIAIDSFTLIGRNGPWTFPLPTTSGPAQAGGTGDGLPQDIESGEAEPEDTEPGA